MSERTIPVYVRLGAGNNETVRTISFQRPSEISQTDAITRGWAIDGNEFVMDVVANTDEDRPLMEQLRCEQEALISWLADLDYEVDFR